ncbi:MAG: zf-HC2 domain-containing protein [Candidatus Riflebacteria bacterium]|nr:zf-HC2 domain-containing protein [Candidatus Riflebacteria bacterium]
MNQSGNACGIDSITLQRYLENDLSIAEKSSFESHLPQCESCRKKLVQLRKLFSNLDNSLKPSKSDFPGRDQISKTMKKISNTSAPNIAESSLNISGIILKLALPMIACVGIASYLSLQSSGVNSLKTPVQSPMQPVHSEKNEPHSAISCTQISQIDGKSSEKTVAISRGVIFTVPSDTTLKIIPSESAEINASENSRFSLLDNSLSAISGIYLCDFSKSSVQYSLSVPGGKIVTSASKFMLMVTSQNTEIRLESGNATITTPISTEKISESSIRFISHSGRIMSEYSDDVSTVIFSGDSKTSSPVDTSNAAPSMNQGF